MAKEIIPLFKPMGNERTLVSGAMELGHVQIIVTTETSIVVVPYILSAKESVVMQATCLRW